MIRIFGKPYSPLALLATLAIGAAGVMAAIWLGAPIPFLFGPVVAVGAAAVAGLRIGDAPMCFPQELRGMSVPVIGVAIGGAFSPALLREAGEWWPSLLALLLYVPLLQFVGYALYRRAGRLDPITAWYGAMPGGFVEALMMGEERGAHVGLLASLQFLRLILCILLVPLGFSVIHGGPVGSAAGVQLPGAGLALGLLDAAILLVCAVLGFRLYRMFNIPAGMVVGPMLLSGAAHLGGIVQGQPPLWLIQATQFVIGLSLGVRFTGVTRGDLWRAFRVASFMVGLTLALAAALGALLGSLVGETAEAIVLAFAPGGLVEMSLVAFSLGISTVYVTAHHVVRIVLTVFFSRFTGDVVLRRFPAGGGG
ncbi:MAG: AbrB family transcriptional regulator [Alphaproteobacteria bacterium]|nr:MAG: AbrB family transcriptional regulator [Alphaproteobacteria bacterium]